MGGLVNTSIRFEDGEILNTLIYTSTIDLLFTSKAFYERDKKAIKKLISKIKMKTWDDKKFDAVAPYHYGLITADFISSTIIDMQGYCSIGKYTVSSFDLPSFEDLEFHKKSEYYEIGTVKFSTDLFLSSRVLGLNYYDKDNKKNITNQIENNFDTFEDVYAYILHIKDTYPMLKIIYDTHCNIIKIADYDFQSYLSALSLINYPLTKKDNVLFNKFITQHFKDN